MGTIYRFICNQCGYEVEVSGGRDFGMIAVVQTYVCEDCRELVDVDVGEYGKLYPCARSHTLRCPKCRGANLKTWSTRAKLCPRCQEGKMVRGEQTILWD